jgi:hypothetical protein
VQAGTQLAGDLDDPPAPASRVAHHRRRILPLDSSIEKEHFVVASPTSKTRTTAGCVTRRQAGPSWRSRSRPGLAVERISFSATGVFEHQVVGAPQRRHAALAEAGDHPVAHAEYEAGWKVRAGEAPGAQ